MFVLDAGFREVEEPDEALGSLSFEEARVTHRWVVDADEQGHWEVIAEYENGGKDVEWKVDEPERGHWETRLAGGAAIDPFPGAIPDDWPHDQEVPDVFQYLLYTPYTEEELAEIADARSEAERREEISSLKAKLAETDYVVTKIAEFNVTGEPMPEADAERYAAIIEKRQAWRSQVKELEARAPEGGDADA